MAAAFDTFTTVESDTGTTLGGTHTPVGTPTLVIVSVEIGSDSPVVVGTPLYASTAMTLVAGPIDTGDAPQSRLYAYKLESPPAGAQLFSVTLDKANVARQVTVATFTGTPTASATRTPADAQDAGSGSTTPSVAVTTVAGDLVYDIMGHSGGTTTRVAGADQTKLWEFYTTSGGNNVGAAASTETASGVTTTMSWTLGATRPWAIIAIPVIGVTLESVAIDITAAATVAVAVSEVANEAVAIDITATSSVAVAVSLQTTPEFPIEPCRVEVFATGSPATTYVALLSYPWGPARVPVELAGNGYARVALPNTSTYWEPQGTGVGNAQVITFPVALADLGTVLGWAIYDHPTLATAEHLLANGRLPTPRPVPEATYAQFAPNNLFISLAACGGTLMVYELAADLWSGYEGWVENSEWGRCQTCDHTVPVRELLLNPRYGWQCITGKYGIGCWDGLIQRDELVWVPPPGEGSRRSPSPTDGVALAADAPPQLNDTE